MLLPAVQQYLAGLAAPDHLPVQRGQPRLPRQDLRGLPACVSCHTLLLVELLPQPPRGPLVRCHHGAPARECISYVQGQQGGPGHIRFLYALGVEENMGPEVTPKYAYTIRRSAE